MPDFDAYGLARWGAVLSSDTRASILCALMGGSAHTHTELARFLGRSPSSVSEHVGVLIGAGLVTVEAQGRHRYVRLADRDVAEIIERLGTRQPVIAVETAHLANIAVQFDHAAASRALMKAIDVLRDQSMDSIGLLHRRQRVMRGIRMRAPHQRPAGHTARPVTPTRRLAADKFLMRDRRAVLPARIVIAIGRDAGARADAGAELASFDDNPSRSAKVYGLPPKCANTRSGSALARRANRGRKPSLVSIMGRLRIGRYDKGPGRSMAACPPRSPTRGAPSSTR